MPSLCLKHGVDPKEISLYCVEAAPTVLPGFPAELVERAQSSLTKRGVTFVTGTPVTKWMLQLLNLKTAAKLKQNNGMDWRSSR